MFLLGLWGAERITEKGVSGANCRLVQVRWREQEGAGICLFALYSIDAAQSHLSLL